MLTVKELFRRAYAACESRCCCPKRGDGVCSHCLEYAHLEIVERALAMAASRGKLTMVQDFIEAVADVAGVNPSTVETEPERDPWAEPWGLPAETAEQRNGARASW